MFIRVAIADPLPIFRRGLQAVLSEAGLVTETFDTAEPDDLRTWVTREEQRVVLITISRDADWELLTDLRRAHPDTILVAMLDEFSTDNYVRAVRAGAAVAAGRDVTPEEVRDIVRAAVGGLSLMPISVVHALASGRPPGVRGPDSVTETEVAWLRELAHGRTVVELARRAGYSERMMFRLLRDLYAKLDVPNRAQALFYAHEKGWV